MRLQKLLSYVRRACQDFDMIAEGDRIAVGLSGGKDSIALLYALSEMRVFYPLRYELHAVMVDLGLDGFDPSPVVEVCAKLGVELTHVRTEIGEIIFEIRREKNPCSLCSKMRKAALNNDAVRLGCNKVALGHNRDDVCQTFFMSLFYEGRINTFRPVTYLDRTNLYAIRPLIYTPESDIVGFVRANGIPTVKNPCKADGYTKREDMKAFIREKREQIKDFDTKIFTAIRDSEINGWKGSNINVK